MAIYAYRCKQPLHKLFFSRSKKIDSKSKNSIANVKGNVDDSDHPANEEIHSGGERKCQCRSLGCAYVAVTLVWGLFTLPFILFYARISQKM